MRVPEMEDKLIWHQSRNAREQHPESRIGTKLALRLQMQQIVDHAACQYKHQDLIPVHHTAHNENLDCNPSEAVPESKKVFNMSRTVLALLVLVILRMTPGSG